MVMMYIAVKTLDMRVRDSYLLLRICILVLSSVD